MDTGTFPLRVTLADVPAAARAVVCSGSCNGEYRRAQAAYARAIAEHDAAMARWLGTQHTTPPPPRPEPPDITATPGEPIWCRRDVALIRRCLAELDDLAARAAAEAEGLRAPRADQKVSGSRGTRTPSPLMDMVDDLTGLLRDWEYTVKGRDTPVRRGYLSAAITASVDQLLINFDMAITNPDFGADFGTDIRTWHRKLTSAGHAGTVRHAKSPPPCPRRGCQRMSLMWEEGNDYVECVSCRQLLSLDEYDAYAAVYPHLPGAEGAA
jgi:hypothetical protein